MSLDHTSYDQITFDADRAPRVPSELLHLKNRATQSYSLHTLHGNGRPLQSWRTDMTAETDSIVVLYQRPPRKADARVMEALEPKRTAQVLTDRGFTEVEQIQPGVTRGEKVIGENWFALFVDQNTPRFEVRVGTPLDPDWVKPRLYTTNAIQDMTTVVDALRDVWCSNGSSACDREGEDPMVG